MSNIPDTPEEYRVWWEANSDVPYGLCWCGCGEKTAIAPVTNRRSGNLKGEPRHYRKGHSGRKRPVPVVDEETGCWNWTGTSADAGHGLCYGIINHNGRAMGAHCHYYEKHVAPIPEGYHVHHKCHNTLCVNPGHLEALSPTEHGRLKRSRKLTAEDVKEIRRLLAEGELSASKIARMFSISNPHVCAIRKGHVWRGV